MALPWEELTFYDTPTSSRWRLPEMQKTSLTDATRIWRIGFNGTKLIMWSGQEDGKITPSFRLVKENNSGRDLNQQAWLEAKNRYTIQKRDGFLPPCSGESRMIKIMRAKLYEEDRKNVLFPIDVDQKLDGMRMWCKTNFPYGIDGYSRGNTQFPHVHSILTEVLAFAAYLPPNCAVDGEIWHPKYHLNEISSIVRSRLQKDPRMEEMEYHIYDLWWEDDQCQEVRRKVLETAIAEYRRDTFQYDQPDIYGTGGRAPELIGKTRLFTTALTTVYSHEEIQTVHRHYVDDLGFEGSILRKRANGAPEGSKIYKSSQYVFGKRNHVLKVIDYIYEEGRCLGVVDAEGSEEGCGLLVIRDIRGNVFTIRPDGPFDQRREWLKDPSLVKGKYITFKYKQLSVHNKPLNSTGKGIRDEPGWEPDVEIPMTPPDGDYSLEE